MCVCVFMYGGCVGMQMCEGQRASSVVIYSLGTLVQDFSASTLGGRCFILEISVVGVTDISEATESLELDTL